MKSKSNWFTSVLVVVGLIFASHSSGPAVAADLSRTDEFNYDPPVPGTYELPIVKVAGDGNVVDPTGRSLRLREVTSERVTVMSFIYTRCASAKGCPFATGVLRKLYAQSADDPTLAKGMSLVSLSFDPTVDTPDRMAVYAAQANRGAVASKWDFLTTQSKAELAPILAAYGQAVERKANPLDPTGPLNHALRVFLIDASGRVRNIYSADTLDARLVIADVQTLILESARNRATTGSINLSK